MLELLIVISILTMIIAMLVPGLRGAKEQAWRTQCKNNLRQFGVAYQAYSDDWYGYIPTEGTASEIDQVGAWFNELPPYLDLPSYGEIEGAGTNIREHPELHIWICPAKQKTVTYKSTSGYNQFHYGMNRVLDGMGDPPDGSKDTPGFPDQDRVRENDRGWEDEDEESHPRPVNTSIFAKHPNTVLLFDILPNSPSGSPRDVATMYSRGFNGQLLGRFHGDFANLLLLQGAVEDARADEIVEGRDFRRGKIIWNNPRFYWGYPPPMGLPEEYTTQE